MRSSFLCCIGNPLRRLLLSQLREVYESRMCYVSFDDSSEFLETEEWFETAINNITYSLIHRVKS